MKILVLGGNGFIGSHLVDRLVAGGHFVRVFDKYEEHYRPPLAQVDYCLGDFGNRGILANALKGIDIVYQLISTTLPKTSNDDPIFDVSSNVIETLSLLEESLRCGIKKIIFTSSGGTIYGNPVSLPISEDSSTNPECSYGITKLVIEKYLALYHHLYGLNYTIIRPANPYGSRQNPNGIQGVIPIFLGKIQKKEPIIIWGNGDIIRDYIYIDDLTDALYKAMYADCSSKVFNIGSGVGTSLNAILEVIRSVTKQEFDVLYEANRSFDIPSIWMDITRAKKELSWEPKISLDAGIKETWKFVRQVVPR